MTVPSRVEAARLLRSLDPPAWHVRHSRAVAEIAGWLALRASHAGRTGRPVDRRLTEVAALLHDVDKALAPEQRGDGPHGQVGGRWLAGLGHPELGEAVALHPVTLLIRDVGARSVLDGPIEARIVAYADKRAGQRLGPMAARFAYWTRRYPDGWGPDGPDGAWRRARILEDDVCALAGCRPEEVRRLRWTAGAFAAARAGRP